MVAGLKNHQNINLGQGRADCRRWRTTVMKRKWFLKDLLKSHMQSLNFTCQVFMFGRRVSYTEHGFKANEYTVHTINECLIWLSLFSARPPPLPLGDLRQRVQLMNLGLSHISSSFWIKTSTLSTKAASQKRFFAVWLTFIYIADIASLCDMVGMCTGMSSALGSPGLSLRSHFLKLSSPHLLSHLIHYPGYHEI